MKIVFILILFFNTFIFSQVKVSWDIDITGNTLFYNVYYCAGSDSSLFPLKEGSNHDEVSEWLTGSTLYPYFYVKETFNNFPFFRVGIIGVNFLGEKNKMSIKTFRRLTPAKITGIKLVF